MSLNINARSGEYLSASFTPSSWSSSFGVADALASYRRSQYIIAGQNVASSVDTDDRSTDLEDVQVVPRRGIPTDYVEEEEEEEEDASTPMPVEEDAMISNLDWDEDVGTSGQQTAPAPTTRRAFPGFQTALPRYQTLEINRPGASRPFVAGASRERLATEQTPLLHRISSRSSVTLQPYGQKGDDVLDTQITPVAETSAVGGSEGGRAYLKRKASATSTHSEKIIVGGQSTFGQTLFNSIAILLGFGMLSEPLAFAYAGWIGGTILIIAYGLVTCYTAKILAHIMIQDPQIRTYADIGNKAFGQSSQLLTSMLFCLELFAVSVVLVTLYGDSLHSISPAYSANTYKLFGLIILIPSVLFPLSVLSYTSILGILSTLLIIGVLLFDGLSKLDAPGSLWSPADTSLSIASWGELGIAFGLVMAGFSGHAVLPSLARDMADPRDFDKMINWAFSATTVIYFIIGASGYLMFGNSVSDEVTKDLLATPGYNKFLNQLAVWSMVIMPLTKFALATRPVNITLEIILGIEANDLQQGYGHEAPTPSTSAQLKSSRSINKFLTFVERTVFACLSVAVSIFVPEFSSMMAFLGSFSAFLLCVIGPISAKIALTNACSFLDAFMLVAGVVMAAWGTATAFLA